MAIANATAADVVTGLIAMPPNVVSMRPAMDRYLFHVLIVESGGLIGQGNCVRGQSRDAGE
jgi:hypothetical protein